MIPTTSLVARRIPYAGSPLASSLADHSLTGHWARTVRRGVRAHRITLLRARRLLQEGRPADRRCPHHRRHSRCHRAGSLRPRVSDEGSCASHAVSTLARSRCHEALAFAGLISRVSLLVHCMAFGRVRGICTRSCPRPSSRSSLTLAILPRVRAPLTALGSSLLYVERWLMPYAWRFIEPGIISALVEACDKFRDL